MAGTMIDVVMKDLSFLEAAKEEMALEEKAARPVHRRQAKQQTTTWNRLLGFLQLVR